MSPIKTAMSAVRADPKNSRAWSTLGEALAAEGLEARAREAFERALLLDPLNGAARGGRAALTEEEAAPAASPAIEELPSPGEEASRRGHNAAHPCPVARHPGPHRGGRRTGGGRPHRGGRSADRPLPRRPAH